MKDLFLDQAAKAQKLDSSALDGGTPNWNRWTAGKIGYGQTQNIISALLAVNLSTL